MAQHAERPEEVERAVGNAIERHVLHAVQLQSPGRQFRLEPLRDVGEVDRLEPALGDVLQDRPVDEPWPGPDSSTTESGRMNGSTALRNASA